MVTMLQWIYNYGSFVQFFFQIVFWIGILVCAIIAVSKFSKLVDAKIAADAALMEMYGADDECGCGCGEHNDDKKGDVEVEKFVD